MMKPGTHFSSTLREGELAWGTAATGCPPSAARCGRGPPPTGVILGPIGRRIWRGVTVISPCARFLSRLKTAGLRNDVGEIVNGPVGSDGRKNDTNPLQGTAHGRIMTSIRSFGICTGVGDAPVLNAVIRAAVKSAILKYKWKVIGIPHGFDGL